MNVNGINDPEMIKLRAKEILNNKEKVNLGKEDLETLWENVKLSDPSISELGLSDEDAIAQFDALDNEENTALTSYKLFFNWLRNGAFNVPSTPEATTPPATDTDTTVPDTDTTVPDTDTTVPDTDTTVPDTDTTVPDTDTTVPDTDTTVPDTDTTVPDTDTTVPDTDTTVPDTGTTVPDTEETTTTTPQSQKTYIQLFNNESTTVEIDGKSYSITNNSSTVNNFAYYIKDGVVTIEGSDLTLNPVEGDASDNNVKLMGNRNTLNFGAGNDTVDVEGSMNSVFGGDGNDFVKLRGDYNTTNLQGGNDIAWIAGNTNVAIGAGGDDNFFAIGQGNTLYGQDDADGKYYNTSEGVGHDYRVENTITNGTDFEKWVKGEETPGGPPYITPPTAPEGHEVRAYDDNTYTDKYEQSPNYITEYRDIAYRELQAETTVDRVDVGNATVTKYAGGKESESIVITPESVTIKNANGEATIPASEVVYKDANGNTVANTGTIDNLVEQLATGKYTIDTTGYIDAPQNQVFSTFSTPAVNDNLETEQTTSTQATQANTAQGQKVYIQLFNDESTTLDFDGKKYKFTNVSSTVNNFAYYVQDGVVTIEGSDLNMEALDDDAAQDDNIKIMGNRNTISSGNGNDTVEAEGSMNSVFGGDGDDFVMLRGDYNTANTQDGADTVWMAGQENAAIGANGNDNFFAIGKGNTLYGQDGTDGKYYNTTEGVGHDYRVENTITDGTAFEKWVNKEEPTDGPPYATPPTAEKGHEVRAYDDNTYTDKYEVTPNYITEYRDIAYRGLQAETSVDRDNVGNATVTKYENGEVSETIAITPEDVTVTIGGESITIPASEISYEDANGNLLMNTGTIDNLVEMLATGKCKISSFLLEQIKERINASDDNA